jgi:hypothetical protein
MEPTLSHLPSDVFRIILRNILECPFTLGVLGRVCRELYAKTNMLTDIWEHLASLTPLLGPEIDTGSSEKSKIDASRVKLNLFAALVNRMKLNEANVSVVSEARRPYGPKISIGDSSELSDPNPIDYLRDDDFGYCYTYRLLHTAESRNFIIETTEECAAASFMNCRLVGFTLYSVDNVRTGEDVPIEEGWRRPLIFGDRYVWNGAIHDQSENRFRYSDIIDGTDVDLDTSTEIPFDRSTKFVFNKHSAFPWIMILSGEKSAVVSEGDIKSFSMTVSVFDAAERRVIIRQVNTPLTVPSGYSLLFTTFFADFFFLNYRSKGHKDLITCCKVDPENGTVCALWSKPGVTEVHSVIDSIATVSFNKSYALLSLQDGAVILESRPVTPESVASAYGRFYVTDYGIWDFFDPSKPLMKLPTVSKIHFLDSSHLLIETGSSCYLVNVEAPLAPANASITCCAVGKLEFNDATGAAKEGKEDSVVRVRVDFEPELVDLNTSELLQQVCSLLGCTLDQLGYRHDYNFPNQFVFLIISLFFNYPD